MSSLRTPLRRARRGARSRGFTLVEMLVAMTVGVVMVGGFAVMFVNMKSTFKAQDSLAALQDSERLAMTVLNSAVQQAGYFAIPASLNTARDQLIWASSDATYGAWVAGRSVYGTATNGSVAESFQTAFSAASGDTLLNCLGGANTSGANVTYRNVFTFDATNRTLKCKVLTTTLAGSTYTTVDSGFQNLIGNVSAMTVWYGVDSNGSGTVTEYLPASGMASFWDSVKAVRIRLTLVNGSTSSSPTVTWTHTINLMNNQ